MTRMNRKEKFKKIQDDILFLCEVGLGLTPQPLLPQYRNVPIEEWRAEHFGSVVKIDEYETKHWEFPTFIRGKHLTWQQTKVLHFVNKSKKDGKKMIAVASGRGIGKTMVETVIIIWSLLQCRDSQGACTSYSKDLIYDILWKELAKTHKKLDTGLKSLFTWTATRFSVADSSETWFVSAKTGKKENPEALAGVHGEYVLLLGDEASGIDDVIFETALDGLTEKKYLVFMASNWRRLTGFFHEQCTRADAFEVLKFNSLESPLYNTQKAIDIAKSTAQSGGIDSDRYKIEVLGQPPNSEGADNKGFKPLLQQEQLNIVEEVEFVGPKRLCIDYAGVGRDTTIWIIRDDYSARIVAEEAISDEKSLERKTDIILTQYDVQDVIGDSFGIGATPLMQLSNKREFVKGKNVGIPATNSGRYANLRAEAYWNMREELIKGFQLERHKRWDDLLTVRYASNRQGKIVIMDKLTMKKLGYKSPDAADALMLGFTEKLVDYEAIKIRKKEIRQRKKRNKSNSGYNLKACGY